MSDLLEQQDHVIEELENLDRQLLATIEAFRATKEKAAKESAGTAEPCGSEIAIPAADALIEVPTKRAA